MYFSENNKKGWRLLGVPFIFAIFLLAVPIATMTTLSFWTQDYLTLIKTITLDNYKQAWFQPVFQTLFARSLIISLTVTFITILFAFPIAYYISFYGGKRKALWLFLITIPFWTSYLLRMFLWKVILGYNGVLNSFFEWLGVITEPLTFLLYNSNAVVLALVHGWAPFAILPIFVSLDIMASFEIKPLENLSILLNNSIMRANAKYGSLTTIVRQFFGRYFI